MKSISSIPINTTDPVTTRVVCALGRLLREAVGETRQSDRCAEFLLSLVYPAHVAPLRISTLGCGLSQPFADDIETVFGAALRLQSRFAPIDALGYGKQFRSLLEIRNPEALGLPPSQPHATAIMAFRLRHDLSTVDLATMLSVPGPEVLEWESGAAPMPLPLWQAARLLMGETARPQRDATVRSVSRG